MKFTTDRLILWATALAVLAEVGLNYATSYQHLYTLGLRYGEYGVDARLNPVAIDLALLVFGLACLYLTRKGRSVRMMRAALALGVAGTVVGNAAYGAFWGHTGALLAVWSPVLLFATVEAGMVVLRVEAEEAEKAHKSAKFTERATKAANTRRAKPDYSMADSYAASLAEQQALRSAMKGEWTTEGKEPTPTPQMELSGIGLSQNGSY